jgi:hypothetical protein
LPRRAAAGEIRAGRQIDKPADKLVSRYLEAHGDGAALVEADEMKGVLVDVETDRSDGIKRFGFAS